MRINSISNIPFKSIYVSKGLRPGPSALVAYKLTEDIKKLHSYRNLSRLHDCDVYIQTGNKFIGFDKIRVFLFNGKLDARDAAHSSIIKDVTLDCPTSWDDTATYKADLKLIDEACKSPNLVEKDSIDKDYSSIYDNLSEQNKYGWFDFTQKVV